MSCHASFHNSHQRIFNKDTFEGFLFSMGSHNVLFRYTKTKSQCVAFEECIDTMNMYIHPYTNICVISEVIQTCMIALMALQTFTL